MEVIDIEKRIEKEWGWITIPRAREILGWDLGKLLQRIEVREKSKKLPIAARWSGLRGVKLYERDTLLSVIREDVPHGMAAHIAKKAKGE